MDTKNNIIRKFYYALPNNGSQEGLCSTTQRWEEAEICSEIAEEFAIRFAEWTSYKYKYLENKGWFRSSYELEMGIFKSSKELLKIYKEQL